MPICMSRVAQALIALLCLPAVAAAQAFPSKPIGIIATATAGGRVGTSARMVAQNRLNHFCWNTGEKR